MGEKKAIRCPFSISTFLCLATLESHGHAVSGSSQKQKFSLHGRGCGPRNRMLRYGGA